MHASTKKTQITILIRIPTDAPDDYSAAETHINTIREISKQDSNIIVLDHKGVNHVNLHKSFGAEKYKEHFQPREKNLPNGATQVSVAHHILSEVQNFDKTLLLPFLKKNKVFVYFYQKEGLEHFSAIGVLFGPHPELSWREDIIEKIEKTMKADISQDECETINTSFQNPKIVISMVPQQISNIKHNETKSIALEIRVPSAHESTYLSILDRLNERASLLKDGEVDITLDERLGNFFPYYAKRSRPSLFDSLMRKQNSDMNGISAIPIFGLTPDAMEYEVTDKHGNSTNVRSWIYSHNNIQKMEKTASSKDIGKFMLLVDRDEKETVDEFLDGLFEQIPEDKFPLGSFQRPQRGGNAFRKRRVNNIDNYLNKLEERVNAELSMYDDDDLSTTPPTRPRRMTISYAQATRRLSFSDMKQTQVNSENTTETNTASMSTLTQSSLDAALNKLRQENENAISSLRNELKNEVCSMEDKIANSVIKAIKSPPMDQMNIDNNNNDATSMGSSNQETIATMQTFADQIESLKNMVTMLTERVVEIAEKQEESVNKRPRPPATPPKFYLPPEIIRNQTAQSPPTKVPRAKGATTPTIPSPKGTPTDGAREGQ
jgi:hypothetical protein